MTGLLEDRLPQGIARQRAFQGSIDQRRNESGRIVGAGNLISNDDHAQRPRAERDHVAGPPVSVRLSEARRLAGLTVHNLELEQERRSVPPSRLGPNDERSMMRARWQRQHTRTGEGRGPWRRAGT
jgi:hypothetical protein